MEKEEKDKLFDSMLKDEGFLKDRPTSTLGSLSTMLSSVFVVDMGNKSLTIDFPITCKTEKGNKIVETTILLDTGAGGMFMQRDYAKKHGVVLHKLLFLITP